MQREWFEARARGHKSTLEAALFGNNIPTAVVENLIRETKAGVEPFRRYHRLRRRVLGLSEYFVVRRIRAARRARRHAIAYEEVLDWIIDSVAPLGEDYRATRARGVRRPLDRRLREPGEAQRRLLGAGVRRASVHAAQLQRHARCGVHAGARDGPLDSHAAVARDAAVRVRGLHDLRRRGAVDAERSAAARLDARARDRRARSASCCCSTPSTASSARSTTRCCSPISSSRRTGWSKRTSRSRATCLSDIYARLLDEYWGDALSPTTRAPR